MWWVVGRAGSRSVGGAGAVRANLVVFAVGPDVAVFLAFIAANRFADVFTYCNNLTFDVDPLAEQMVGRLRRGASYFEGGYCLVGGATICAFQPGGRGDGTRGEVVIGFDGGETIRVGGVEVTSTRYKLEDEVEVLGLNNS